MEKTFASREFSVISRAKTFANLDLDYAMAETFSKNAEKHENRKTLCPRKFLPLK